MKKFKGALSLFFFLFISLNGYSSNLCYLNFTKEGAGNENIEIEYVDNYLSSQKVSLIKDIINGSADFHFFITTPKEVWLKSGDKKYYLFFNPGDSISVKLANGNISFLGKNKRNEEFANEYINIIDTWEATNKTDLSPQSYLMKIEERDSSLSQLLQSYKNLISASCYNYYFYDSYYRSAYERLFFRRYKRSSEISNDYFDFLDEIKFSYDFIPSTSHYYLTFLNEYLLYKQKESDNPVKAIDVILKRPRIKQYKYAASLFAGKTLEYVRANIILTALENKVRYKSIAKKFLKAYPDSEFSGLISSQVVRSKEIISGKPAPLFVLENSAGEGVSLSQYKGKVVYLIFWSSGCKPCIENIPRIKEIKNSFNENSKVVFLHISLDENPHTWKKSISKYNLDGVNLIADWREMGELYNFSAIPFYVLIDKKGNVAGFNDPKNSLIKYQIKKLL